MATNVFISYSREDADAANRICAMLERDGITCWIAPRNIPPGQEWPVAIAAAIRSSRILVVLLSSHSYRSKQIAREAEIADRNGLSIVTFRLEEVDPPEALEYFLTNLQWIDGFGQNFDAAVGNLIYTVRWRLSLPATKPPEPQVRQQIQPAAASVKPRSRKKIWIAGGLAIGILWLIGYAVDENSRRSVYVPPPLNVKPAQEPATNTAQPLTPANTTAPASGELAAGTWSGTYYCVATGLNQMQLTISPAGGTKVNAVMQFAVPTGVPGTYEMHGTIAPADNLITLTFTRWQYVPPGTWLAVNLQGQLDSTASVIRGRVLLDGCGAFEVHRLVR
jgi:hypothetical protein